MERVTVNFVRFLSPGAFFADDWTAEVFSLDPYAVVWPERAYAFTMHQRIDAHDGPEVFRGEPRQIGPMYYHPDSKVRTLAEVKLMSNPGPALISNMRINGWDAMIYTRWDTWPQPYDPAKCEILK